MLKGGKKTRPRRNQWGRSAFTLVEVLAALMLVAIVLPVAMKGVSTASEAASAARHRNEAAALAQSKLDELLTTQDPNNPNAQDGAMSGDFGTDWPGYQWTAEYVTWSPNGMNMSAGLGVTYQQSQSNAGVSTPAAASSSSSSASSALANASSANNSLQELDVHVTWLSRNQQQTLTLSTLIYSSGNTSTSSTSGTSSQ